MQFGCFVQIFGIRQKQEGLVHISQVLTNIFRLGNNYFKIGNCHFPKMKEMLFFKR